MTNKENLITMLWFPLILGFIYTLSASCLVGQVCDKDSDCSLKQPKCVNSHCAQCKTDADCFTQMSCKQGLCKTSRSKPDSKYREASSEETKSRQIESKSEAIADRNTEGISEQIGSDCKNGGRKSCYTGGSETQQKGECHDGFQECQQGKWQSQCKQEQLPLIESCNGKDDDCDGEIDEGTPQLDCKTYQKGLCAQGKIHCTKGKNSCIPNVSPETEICNDKQDNDCDGEIDEGCLLKHAYIMVKSNGDEKKKRGFISSKKKATGIYQLHALNVNCPKQPIFVLPESRQPLLMTFYCEQGKYDIHFNSLDTKGRLKRKDVPFYAIIPQDQGTWGYVAISSCINLKTCKPQFGGGNFVIARLDKGLYKITSKLCQKGKPIFVATFSNMGNISITAKATSKDTCIVSTIDHKSQPTDRSFSFWLPNPDLHLWAIVSSKGTLEANNQDPKAKWNISLPQNRQQLTHLDWNGVGAALLTPHNHTLFGVRALPKGIEIYANQLRQSKQLPADFSVLFVQ